jgi:hypothetical protein
VIGEKNNKTPVSSYQPSNAVVELTREVKKDYEEGIRILTQPWVELNDRSVIDDYNRGLMMFNGFVDTSVKDPNEAWKWRGTRSMARNKGIAMHAQLMGNFLMPSYVAQNENDEVDKDFSEVMRDIAEWLLSPTVSNYQQSYLQIGFSMLYSPVTYLGAEWYEIYQKIKQRTKEGKVSYKEVLDDVLSGYKAPIWSANQILITNPYERNIQKQKAIIKRRYTEYSELEAKYKNHENWPYVQKGVKSIYNDEDGLFYDIKDDDHPNLVAEETWLNRRKDLEVCFVNGIYLGTNDVETNLIKHRDNQDKPKYNLTPFGYTRIGEHFFFYKSMMNALQWDNMAYDAMSEIVFNRAVLENEMPVAVSGTDKVDSSVIFPNAVVAFEDKDTRITPLLPQSNIVAGFNSLREVEKSMSEGSVSETLAGQLPEASQKAFNVATAQSNARRLIGAVGKSLAESVTLYGDLVKDIIINHVTVPEVEELTGGKLKMKYKTFLLENKKNGSKLNNRTIKFSEDLIGLEMTEEEKTKKELELLETSGYPDESESIRHVNPEMFAKFRYLTKADVQEIFTRSNEYWQPILLSLKAQLAQDPFIKQDVLTRKTLQAFFNSEGDELMKDETEQIPGLPPAQGNQGGQMANQVFNKMTANAVEGQII